MDYQGNTHGLEAAPCQLRPGCTGRGRQVSTANVGKINACTLEHSTVCQYPTAAPASLGTLPLIDNKVGRTIFFGLCGANIVLKL